MTTDLPPLPWRYDHESGGIWDADSNFVAVIHRGTSVADLLIQAVGERDQTPLTESMLPAFGFTLAREINDLGTVYRIHESEWATLAVSPHGGVSAVVDDYITVCDCSTVGKLRTYARLLGITLREGEQQPLTKEPTDDQ
jgi:hypothetical protein